MGRQEDQWFDCALLSKIRSPLHRVVPEVRYFRQVPEVPFHQGVRGYHQVHQVRGDLQIHKEIHFLSLKLDYSPEVSTRQWQL